MEAEEQQPTKAERPWNYYINSESDKNSISKIYKDIS